LNAKNVADKWSAAINPTSVKYEIDGSKIQSETNAETAPAVTAPKIVKKTIGDFVFDLYMFRVVEHVRRQWFECYMTNVNILDADAMLSVCLPDAMLMVAMAWNNCISFQWGVLFNNSSAFEPSKPEYHSTAAITNSETVILYLAAYAAKNVLVSSVMRIFTILSHGFSALTKPLIPRTLRPCLARFNLDALTPAVMVFMLLVYGIP
jgi:hypothetical protein